MNNKADQAFVFVTDAGFLVPTLVALDQLQRKSAGRVQCFVFLSGKAIEMEHQLNKEFGGSGVVFAALELERELNAKSFHFHENHVPITSLGRFWIGDLLPDRIKRFVYLDGDVQVLRDISSLSGLSVPNGMIAAATDAHALIEPELPPAGYLSSLGISDSWAYFNAGVFVVNTNSWREISRLAFKFFVENSKKCIRHDQSALNAVCQDRRMHLHPGLNFSPKLDGLFLAASLRPSVLHFVGAPKPWANYGDRPMWADPSVRWRNQLLMPYWDLFRKASWLFQETNFCLRQPIRPTKALYIGARRIYANSNRIRRIMDGRRRMRRYMADREFLG